MLHLQLAENGNIKITQTKKVVFFINLSVSKRRNEFDKIELIFSFFMLHLFIIIDKKV